MRGGIDACIEHDAFYPFRRDFVICTIK